MKNIIIILALLLVATTAFALPGDPPLPGTSCNPEEMLYADDPDFPVSIPVVNAMIADQKKKMLKAKIAPYTEIDPNSGREFYKRRYQPQVDTAQREVTEWERRVRGKAEKYVEVHPCSKFGLVIRMKYLQLLW